MRAQQIWRQATCLRQVADIFSDISKIYVGSTVQTTEICYRNVGCLQFRQHVGILQFKILLIEQTAEQNKPTTIKNVGIVEGANPQKRTPPWQSQLPGSGMAMVISKAPPPENLIAMCRTMQHMKDFFQRLKLFYIILSTLPTRPLPLHSPPVAHPLLFLLPRRPCL